MFFVVLVLVSVKYNNPGLDKTCYIEKNIFVNQQALYSEIKGRKEKVDDVVKDSDTCAASIKVRLDFFVLIITRSIYI